MVMLVSIEQASAHLRRDTDADDLDLMGKIMGASQAVMTYLDGGSPIPVDSNGDVISDSNGIALDVPFDIQIATLLFIGDMYKNREPKPDDPVPSEYGYGYYPRAVLALLYPYRTPSIG